MIAAFQAPSINDYRDQDAARRRAISFPTIRRRCVRSPRTCSSMRAGKAPPRARPRCRKASGRPSRCGAAKSKPLNTTATKGIGVTTYIGKRRGHASTSDFRRRQIRATADAALSIAKFTASDDYAGLADEELLVRESRILDLFYPWDLPSSARSSWLRRARGLRSRSKAITNSEGATVSLQQSHFAYGNSLGFLGGYPSSLRHWISCAV